MRTMLLYAEMHSKCVYSIECISCVTSLRTHAERQKCPTPFPFIHHRFKSQSVCTSSTDTLVRLVAYISYTLEKMLSYC
uniref:Uncharacterized protein n=1 Tax=Anguilla anguilla TaxID=7936 RepID=A0A0E9XW39_ANGAN